jgi:hypothetical protein
MRSLVLLALPSACAGAEIEGGNSFTGGVQTATATNSDSAGPGSADDDATGGDDDDGSGSVSNDGGSADDADADASITQGSDDDADSDGSGPDDGNDDANCVPGEEVCDGVDNDCDDDIDEDDPALGAECQTGMPGACAAGANECQGGDIVCVPLTSASDETCNGVDDDCDGSTDQGNPGGGGSCNTGLPGVCASGTNQCQSGGIVCNQNTQSGAEACDGEDDDCDGSTDEGNPGGGGGCNTGLPGVCAAGTQTCQGGGLACVQNVGAGAEACGDGQDNDCDGNVDN